MESVVHAQGGQGAPRTDTPHFASHPNAPQTKVWRPQGFVGVEIEKLNHITSDVAPYFLNGFYEITVGRSRDADIELRYMGERHRLSLKENLFLIQQPGEIVGAKNLDRAPITAWTLRLYPEAVTSLLDELQFGSDLPFFPSTVAPESVNTPLTELALQAIDAFDGPVSQLERGSYLLGLMHATIKHCSDTKLPDEKPGKERHAVALVREVIHTHPEYDHSLKDLSDLTGLHQKYLISVFKQEVGVPPHQYLLGVRVGAAKHALAKGEAIIDVAHRLGFTDQSSFTKVFKRFVQVTPGRFQRDSVSSN